MKPPPAPALAVAACLAHGCFSVDSQHYDGFDATVDALHDGQAPPDARMCEANTIVCDEGSDHYVECSASGMPLFEMDCPLGCDLVMEKCIDVAPSNDIAPYLDQALTDPAVVDITIDGDVTMNTATGEVLDGSTPIEIPSVAFDGSRVFMFKNLVVSGTLKVLGADDGSPPRPVLAAHGTITITGLIDVSADLMANGPGARLSSDTCSGGYVLGGASPSAGAGGAGMVNDGDNGGTAGNGESGGIPGQLTGDSDALVPLRGGCQGGFVLEDPGPSTSRGGGGGGAIQIVSRQYIALTGSGRIDASGGGGMSGAVGSGTIGGGGGGSGGAILLEAPQIIMDGSGAMLSAKGGGGAAAGNGSAAHHGHDGGWELTQALGGSNSGQASGGRGGICGNSSSPGGAGAASTSDGGGAGGSVGRVRFNTRDGTFAPTNGAAIRACQSTGTLATRLVP